MKPGDFKNNLRLMTVLTYIFFQLPGQFRFFFIRQWKDQEPPLYFPVLFLLCIFIFVTLEIAEFKKWNYRYNSRRIPLLLFAVRSLLCFAVMIMLQIPPDHYMLSSFYVLLVFYSFFAFVRPVSLSFTLILTAGILLTELLKIDNSRVNSVYWFFFSTYKSLVMVMFYLFAYYWEKDREKSDENNKLVEDLNTSQAQLREFAREIGKTVALEERTRLARDIHDSVGHALTGIQIQLSKAEAYFDLSPGESRLSIIEARESAREAMEDIRSSLGMLNRKDLHFILSDEIKPVLSKLKSTGIKLNLNITGEQTTYNYSVLIAAYRLIQEGVTNILKHSKARNVELSIVFEGRELRLRLTDDGKGFDPAVLKDSDHFGLHGMKDRMELVRGHLEIISTPDQGCTLNVVLPENPVSLIGESYE